MRDLEICVLETLRLGFCHAQGEIAVARKDPYAGDYSLAVLGGCISVLDLIEDYEAKGELKKIFDRRLKELKK